MVFWLVDALVAAKLQVGLGKLVDFGIYAYESISEVDTKLQKLRKNLASAQAETIVNEEQRARAWEDLAYEARDLIDEIDIALSKLEATNLNALNKLSLALSKQPNMIHMQAQLDDVLDNIRRHFENAQQPSHSRARPQTTSLLESPVFGRETAKKEIINMLRAAPSGANKVSIISILGMVGIGKTTLARLVYNEEVEPPLFHLKMWVSVNEDFDVMKLSSSIIEAANGVSTSHLLNLESLQHKLKEILQNKRFMLVLDDLCHENPEELDLLLRPLRAGLEGSKILVTTRSRQVASSLKGATGPYHLKSLLDQDCWSIIKDQIQTNVDSKLEAIGKKIAAKCKGFPLGARNVGRLLSRNINEEAWNSILETHIWSVENEAVGALKSRFCDHLPSHLKDCFAYCSIFPPGHELEKDKLIRMWTGEGLIVPSGDNLGTESLDQLFSMIIFEVLKDEKYKMYEAIQDLALVVYGEKFFRKEETSDSCIPTTTRYLSLISDKFRRKTLEASYKSTGLRTFLLFGKCGTEVPFTLFQKLGLLRVLDLSSSKLEELAKSIGNLKHLRFLDLSNTPLKLLPDGMQELVLLQTLRLVNCMELLYLPNSISKLKSLQHLELGRNGRLTYMPFGIGKLAALQTLCQFVVGPDSGQLSELKDMNNIRGSICISQLEMVSNAGEAREANLGEKCIDELELQWTSTAAVVGCVQDHRNLNDERVLGNLMTGPHYSLKRLTLRKYAGRMLPGWVTDKSSKLTSVFLKDCEFCTVLPPFGQLPNLKSLKIEGMDELKEVDEHFCGKDEGFKALETLEFRRMPKLMKWTGLRNTDMARLRELVIDKCPEMNLLPTLHYLLALEILEFESCPKLPSLPELSSSIEYLTINNCTILKDRCKQGGADWTKIMPIPIVEINYEMVSRLCPSAI